MNRRILVITRNERIGRWFRFAIGGRRVGFPTTVTTDLEQGIRALRRLHPRVVIFVEEKPGAVDERLMLLRALLVNEEHGGANTLAILYDLADGGMTMYHSARVTRVGLEDVARTAAETVACPLFGAAEDAVPGFPTDCRMLSLMLKDVPRANAAVAGSVRDGA